MNFSPSVRKTNYKMLLNSCRQEPCTAIAISLQVPAVLLLLCSFIKVYLQ